MRYPFIEEQRNDYPVTLLCREMQVSRSGYYAWRNEPLTLRKVADLVLLQHIEDIFEEGRQTCGSDRIQGILADQGIHCGRERVARLMQAAGLKPKTRRPFRVIITDSKHQ
jgi:putative transposase